MFNTINNNIIEVLGISSLPREKQEEAMERLGGIVYQETMLRALDIMSDEEKDEFEKLIEKDPDPETMFIFLETKIPNIEEIAKEEAEKLRDEAAEILSAIGN
jgi:hypothetical protein